MKLTAYPSVEYKITKTLKKEKILFFQAKRPSLVKKKH